MTLAKTDRPYGINPTLILAGLVLITLVLRFYRLGEWNFQATEMFTLRDSVKPQWGTLAHSAIC